MTGRRPMLMVPQTPEGAVYLARIAGLENSDYVKSAIQAAVQFGDPTILQGLFTYLYPFAIQAMMEVFTVPTVEQLTQDLTPPYVELGIVEALDRQLFYTIHALLMGLLILGATGSGKSTLMKGVAGQLMAFAQREGTGFDGRILAYDRADMMFRGFAEWHEDLQVHDVARFPRNSLSVPPGMHPSEWIRRFAYNYCGVHGLLDASRNHLVQALNKEFQERGIFDGSKNYPTVYDLIKRIANEPLPRYSEDAKYQHRLLNRFRASFESFEEAFNLVEGVPIESIADNDVVFEASRLSMADARFHAIETLDRLGYHHTRNGATGDHLRTAGFFDEAHYFGPLLQPRPDGDFPIHDQITAARKAGIGLILADQSTRIDPAIIENTRLKICMRMGNMSKALDEMMGFRTETQRRAVLTFRPGQAAVRMPSADLFTIQTRKLREGEP